MNKEQLNALCDSYLEGTAQESSRCLSEEAMDKHINAIGSPDEAMAHLIWMLHQIKGMDDLQKANRWVGWFQGVLWSLGVETLAEQRNKIRNIVHA